MSGKRRQLKIQDCRTFRPNQRRLIITISVEQVKIIISALQVTKRFQRRSRSCRWSAVRRCKVTRVIQSNQKSSSVSFILVGPIYLALKYKLSLLSVMSFMLKWHIILKLKVSFFQNWSYLLTMVDRVTGQWNLTLGTFFPYQGAKYLSHESYVPSRNNDGFSNLRSYRNKTQKNEIFMTRKVFT